MTAFERILAAGTADEIVASLAAANSASDRELSPADLHDWLLECPMDDRYEAAARLRAILETILPPNRMTERKMVALRKAIFKAIDTRPDKPLPSFDAGDGLTLQCLAIILALIDGGLVPFPPPLPTFLRSIVNMHLLWTEAHEHNPTLRHPIAPLVDSWQRLAAERGRITDKRVQIMPRSVAMVEHDAPSYYLPRFGPAAHQAPDGQLLMDFATESERGPTLPAEVWTMGMPEAEKRGAVVPLPFRIWISAVLHVPLNLRHGEHPIKLEGQVNDPLTLRRFLSWPYSLPRNKRTGRIEPPGPAAYWNRLMDAIDLINDHETPYVRNGHLWLRRVVTVDKPGEYNPAMLDDPWGVTVWLPPGDGTGPRVALGRLQRWWKTRGGDAAAVRALINLAFRWHVEGKRLAPAGKDGPWLYRRNPKVYDPLTDDDKIAICFPAGTGKARRDMKLHDADKVITKLVREGDAVWRDGRLLPPQVGTTQP